MSRNKIPSGTLSPKPSSVSFNASMCSPRASLSAEREELRRVLRQDMRDAIRMFASVEVDALRRDVQELLSQNGRRDGGAGGAGRLAALMQEPPAAALSGGGRTMADGVAETGDGVLGVPVAAPLSRGAELALSKAMEAQREEMLDIRLAVSRLAALLERARGASGGACSGGGCLGEPLKDAKDVEAPLGAQAKKAASASAADGGTEREKHLSGKPAPGSSEVRWNAWSDFTIQEADERARGGGQDDTRRESAEMQAADASAAVPSHCSDEVSSTASSEDSAAVTSPVSRATVAGKKGSPYKWEWERSGGKGWTPYRSRESRRIEEAWTSGLSRVHVRSGKERKVPMTIFLVDMVQLDPISLRQRRVRRVGRQLWWSSPQRQLRALSHQIRTGEPRLESQEHYNSRQVTLRGHTVHDLKARMQRTRPNETAQTHLGRWRKWCVVVASSDAFHVVSMVVTVAQLIWIGVDVDRNYGLNLYQKPPFDQFLDYVFCVALCIELFMRFMTYKPFRACWSSGWFCVDALAVLSSILEVFVAPPIQSILTGGHSEYLDGLGGFRAVKAVKIVRISRVFGTSSDAVPFFKGLLSGTRSAAFIWALLLVLVFIFSVVMRLTANEELVDSQFSTMSMTMGKLMISGILLDNVGDVIESIVVGKDWALLLYFAAFVFLANFSLLNMMIGRFCSAAAEVSTSEKDSARIAYMRERLARIVDCYVQDDGKIGKNDFELILENVDVHRTLAHCGSDMAELAALKPLLFFRKDGIDFDSFFKAIVDLRKGQAATVKDVMNVQHALGHQLNLVMKQLDLERKQLDPDDPETPTSP